MPKKTFAPVEEQLQILTGNAVDVVTEEELTKKLDRSRRTQTPLIVKVGFDPTAPDIHIGHTVLLRKMRQFQDLGHRVIFVIGDFTGMIGDPTGRSKTRPALTREQIEANAETYRTQCFKILDPESTEIRFNSEWLGAMTSVEWIKLAAQYNVARMLERNDFKARYQSGRTIGLHEFLYPLAQAYDSVALRADVELGGTDQLFNLNVGRDIMPSYDLAPQVVLTTPLLEGLDGKDKMSKSLGNYVGVEDSPRDIYGKVLSISDDLMWRYYDLCTPMSADGIEQLRSMVGEGQLHPKKAKEGLALLIVTEFHGEDAAQEARQEFERIFSKQGEPDDVAEHRVTVDDNKVYLPHLLAQIGLVASKAEAGRMLKQGAVRIDNEKLPAGQLELQVQAGESRLIKVGKRRFARVIFE